MFPSLRLDRFIGRNHQQNKIDPAHTTVGGTPRKNNAPREEKRKTWGVKNPKIIPHTTPRGGISGIFLNQKKKAPPPKKPPPGKKNPVGPHHPQPPPPQRQRDRLS